MHCPRCGKENPEGANFCMHCGADLREYKVEISPKIEVSPKIHAEAKAEGIPYPKWKQKLELGREYEELKRAIDTNIIKRNVDALFHGIPIPSSLPYHLRQAVLFDIWSRVVDTVTNYRIYMCEKMERDLGINLEKVKNAYKIARNYLKREFFYSPEIYNLVSRAYELYELTKSEIKDDEVSKRIERLEEEIKRVSAVESRDLKRLEAKYRKEDFVKILESFRIVLEMDRMSEENAPTEEFLDKLSLLKNYTEGFSDKLARQVDEFLRFMRVEQFEYLDDAYKKKVKRFCKKLVDLWISEFLRDER